MLFFWKIRKNQFDALYQDNELTVILICLVCSVLVLPLSLTHSLSLEISLSLSLCLSPLSAFSVFIPLSISWPLCLWSVYLPLSMELWIIDFAVMVLLGFLIICDVCSAVCPTKQFPGVIGACCMKNQFYNFCWLFFVALDGRRFITLGPLFSFWDEFKN